VAARAWLRLRAIPLPFRKRHRGPDFFCVGAQKGGTQWLFDQVDNHPDFWMPPLKELHWFDVRRLPVESARRLHKRATRDLGALNLKCEADKRRALGEADIAFLSEYISFGDVLVDLRKRAAVVAYAPLFRHSGPLLTGDVTPGYSKLPHQDVRRIARNFPDAKVIFIARDPVARLWSQIGMRYSRNRGVDLGSDVVADMISEARYYRRSFQSQIVERWRKRIAHGQFGLFFFDDLLADPAGLRHRIISFLGGDPAKPSRNLPPGFNRKQGQSLPMPDEIRDRVALAMADELRASATVLGGPAENWPKLYGL
jgi:hypothetical protein